MMCSSKFSQDDGNNSSDINSFGSDLVQFGDTNREREVYNMQSLIMENMHNPVLGLHFIHTGIDLVDKPECNVPLYTDVDKSKKNPSVFFTQSGDSSKLTSVEMQSSLPLLDTDNDDSCVFIDLSSSESSGINEHDQSFTVYNIKSQLHLPEFMHANKTPIIRSPQNLPQRQVEWKLHDYDMLHHYLYIHHQVIDSKLPNFLGCKLPVPSGFKIPVWRNKLQGTGWPDKYICDMLEYGFPVGYCADILPVPSGKNHTMSYEFPEAVDKYIATELDENSILGPFSENPLCSFLTI